ncbi:MAG: 8-oxoguanine DNA glycosylase [Deltaproteobacteria bacterium]
MNNTNISVECLRAAYLEKRDFIARRLGEFRQVMERGGDAEIFEELVFCIFTAGASAKMGHKSVDATRDVLLTASRECLSLRLRGAHRFPNARSGYVADTRDYLAREYGFKLRDFILSFDDPLKRRDFFALNRNIKGIGYKEASHFLRNIGFGGYAILDKHIIRTLYELGIVETQKPPHSRAAYLEIEQRLKVLGRRLQIDFDELDLLLWSEKTGEILK